MTENLKILEEKLQKQRQQAEENDAERRAQNLGFPYLNLISIKVPTELKAMNLVPVERAKEALLVPLQMVGKKLRIAVFNPQKSETKSLIEELNKNYELDVIIVSMSGLEYAWGYYQYIKAEKKNISGSLEINKERLIKIQKNLKNIDDVKKTIQNFKSPLTSTVLEIILGGAMSLSSSDVHIEPSEKGGQIRFRIDGLLYTVFNGLPIKIHQSLITRIKLLSKLKLNIKNQPQDGRFTIKLEDRGIEARNSIIPSEWGETAVMRLLDPISLKTNLEELGWREDDLKIIKEETKKPNGLILNTGPTGSGKTTTLYALLKYVQRPEIKIITVEDPIEYHLENISQTQVNPSAGYTFASGLRSILRQDPDIILVGEIRDRETAEMAMNASLTGHIVFATLHTNNAIGAIPRLVDLGAKINVLGPSLSLILAQRLARRLCVECKKEKRLSGEERKKIDKFIDHLPPRVKKENYKEYTMYEAGGCDKCGGLGYKGRISIFELLEINKNVENSIYKNPTDIELEKIASEQGMVTMQNDGILKTLQGITNTEEIERLTGPIKWS